MLVLQRRGGVVESVHPFSAVATDADGQVVDACGPDIIATWRSAAKPFQLDVSLEFVPDELAPQLTDRALAVGAASHSAQPAHLDEVRSLWGLLGVSEADLHCGGHWPVHKPSEHALAASHGKPTHIHNNCSGKHTFMAAASKALGADPDYRALDHPLQARILDRIQELSGGGVVDRVIDGCGVPCFCLRLSAMARAWAALAVAARDGSGRLGRIGRAMQSEAFFVSGDGRLDLEVARASAGKVITKVGAAALICGALPETGVGFALKVHSGNNEARAVALAAWLQRIARLGISSAVSEWATVRNVVGKPVGQRIVDWKGAGPWL